MHSDKKRYTPIDTQTKLVALLGHPLGHSLSPVMHNRAFEALGLSFCYLPIEVVDNDLETVTASLAKMNFAGYNVTIPHKIRIMDCLDAIDPLAQAVGAVNTVIIQNGFATGYNTDGIGFVQSLENSGNLTVKGKSVLILGAGGAARSVAMALAQQGASRITLSNRTEAKAHALAQDVNQQGRDCCTAIPKVMASIQDVLRESDILVNTTSVGMHPDEEQSPIDESLLHDQLVVYDLVYNPLRTKLLKAARKKGCRIVEGLGMLVYQGAAAFELWTEREAPVEIMFDAIRPR